MHGPMDGLHGWVIPHKVTDHVFDTLMGEKEIVTIDNIKYEKVQYTFTPTLEQRTVKTIQFLKKSLSNMSWTKIHLRL